MLTLMQNIRRTGRGVQQSLWASALLFENANTGVFALISHFLGSPERNKVPQPMARCYKDEAHSSCSIIGKKDHMAMARCCLQGSPAFGFAQVSTSTCWQQQLQGENREMCSTLLMKLWCFMGIVIWVLLTLMSWSQLHVSWCRRASQNHRMLRGWKGP